MAKGRPDSFYRRAKHEGFAARSVFKLQELDDKHRLIRPGDRVLDLGAAPGSWFQYAVEKVGEKGLVVGVDRTPLSVSIPGHGRFVERDVFECEIENLRNITMEYDVVLSDLAPKTTGNREGDHERSFELCAQAFKVATGVLRSGGNFVCKMYQGPRSKEFLEMLRKVFENCKTQKPSASRSESRELFFVALEFTSAKD